MERAKKIVQELRLKKPPATEQEILNTVREYLLTLALKFVFQSKYGGALSFMGGTALRMCYNLKRYSEDLDFALDDKTVRYDFKKLVQSVSHEFSLRGFDVSTSVSENKIVQKAFLRFAGIGGAFGLRHFHQEQKLHVKLEVDVRPVPLKKSERESFFVHRFQEIFPILKHTLPTLFAGKVLAILFRPYNRGRDYYDLIWYLTQKIELNLDYLNRGAGVKGGRFTALNQVFAAVKEKIETIKTPDILKDIGRFLEDPSEAIWILKYQQLYEQLIRQY